MASACVNNINLDSFPKDPPPSKYSPYDWLSPTRVSYAEDDSDTTTMPLSVKESPERFEFRLDDPVVMLPSADELFSDGKLVPLQISSSRGSGPDAVSESTITAPETEVSSVTSETCRSSSEAAGASSMFSDPYLFSPKAPRCTVRWRDLLRRKKLSAKTDISSSKLSPTSTTTTTVAGSSSGRSIRDFLNRSSKPPQSSSYLNLPLLKEQPSLSSDPVSISSSRLSHSSSEHNDISSTRPSLDTDNNKPHPNMIHPPRSSLNCQPHPRMRQVKPRAVVTTEVNQKPPLIDHPSAPLTSSRGSSSSGGASLDSPRMNSSGKVVFHQCLERSSSSPSSLNGGPRYKHRGVERSYSANVRIKPVLNVPVCSLRGKKSGGKGFGLGQIFSSNSNSKFNKKDGNGNGRGKSQQQQSVVDVSRSMRQSTDNMI